MYAVILAGGGGDLYTYKIYKSAIENSSLVRLLKIAVGH